MDGRHKASSFNKTRALILFAGLSLLLLLADLLRIDSRQPPNILLLVHTGHGAAGGSGYSDLNALAARGLIFTRHQGVADGDAMQASLFASGSELPLPAALREAGYITRHVGAWHLGQPGGEQAPEALGFDSYRSVRVQGAVGYDKEELDDAVSFIESASVRPSPWFLSYWASGSVARRGRTGELRSPPLEQVLGRVLASELPLNTLLVVLASQKADTELSVVFYWPGELEAGLVRTDPVNFADYYPTLALIAGARVVEDSAGRDLFERRPR